MKKKKMHRMSFLIEVEQFRRWEIEAAARHESIADLIRQAVERDMMISAPKGK